MVHVSKIRIASERSQTGVLEGHWNRFFGMEFIKRVISAMNR